MNDVIGRACMVYNIGGVVVCEMRSVAVERWHQ